jgi:hypothetical protein
MQVTDALHVMLLCCRVFCGHHDWVEGVLVCQAKDNAYDQSFMSFSADGHVCCWELDAEQNCDVFRQVVSTTDNGLSVVPTGGSSLSACDTLRPC